MNHVRQGLCFMLFIVATGCSDGDSAPQQTTRLAAHDAAAAGVTAQKGSVKANPVPFAYRANGRRDPFRSYLLDAVARRQAQRAQRVIEETESFELAQYHLSGILTGTSQPKAMVEDPAGTGHVVRIGTRLGRAGGRITRIDSKGITVTEESLDPTGRRLQVPITLLLPATDADPTLPVLGAPP
jgi:type IV pilus assembly protein PilP